VIISAMHSIPIANANDGGGGQPDVFIDENNNGIWDAGESSFDGPDAIRTAILNATDGDTIIVHDGTYTEQLVINKSITLMAGSSPVLDFSGYSGYGIKIVADNVTIDGFEIIGLPVGASGNDWNTKSSSSKDPTILVEANNITVKNCVFNNPTGNKGKEAMLIKDGYENITFDNNTVNNYIWGITGRTDVNNLTVTDSTFYITHIRNNSVGTLPAWIVGAAIQLWSGDGTLIKNNEFYGPKDEIADFTEVAEDEDSLFNCYAFTDFSNHFELTAYQTVENNYVEGFYRGLSCFSSGTYNNNTINGSYMGIVMGQQSAIYATAAGTADIVDNTITNCEKGIMLQDGSASYIDRNTFSGNTYDLYHMAEIVETNHFWGTIQDAIDNASDGDTIIVAAGTYTEQLIINKSIDLVGQSGAKIVAPNNASRNTYKIQESSHTFDPIVFAYGGTYSAGNDTVWGSGVIHVNISGFEIDGNNDGIGDVYAGIFLRNVDGRIYNNYVHNMHVSSGNPQTFCIEGYGNLKVRVDNNTVMNYTRGGIVFNGDLGSLPDPYTIVENNTVVGNGISDGGGWAENGIQIGWGASGIVQYNDVSANGWPGGNWAGTGIIIPGTANVIVRNNDVHDNEVGISTVGYEDWKNAPCHDITIKDNRVYSNVYGISAEANVDHIVIEGNTICDNDYDGIDIWAYNFGWESSTPDNITIQNNKVYNHDSCGIYLSDVYDNISINQNDIYNNAKGIYLDNCYGTDSDAAIHYNNIYNNIHYGVWNNGNILVNVTCNWWGSANGPTHPSNTYNVGYQGDNGSNNVKYCPWLLNPYPQPTNVSSFNITQADFNMTGFSFNPDGNPSTPTYPSSGPDYLNITSVIGTYNMDIPPAGTKYVVVISGWLEADFDENGTWDIHFDFFENIGPRTSPGPSTSWVGSMPFTVAYNGQSFDLIAQYDIDVNGSYPSDSFGDNAHANFTISGPDIMTFNAMLAYMDNISGGDDGYIDGLVRGNISVSCIPLGCPVKNINTGKCYCSIQSAIDNAADGDTIIVGPGIYRESPIINKSLNIIGDPVIDAHGSEYGVQIQANYTLVENFTIYNYTKIGIYIHNDSFTLQNVTVNNCTICNSTYNTGSRGIELNEAKNVSISNCHISNNSEIGIYILRSENSKLENNTISNSKYGFKLSTSSKYNSLLNNTLVKNEQGICLLKSSSRNKLANNNISTSYYGIYVKTSYNQILNNTLLCNGGKGIYLESANNNLVENNTISGGYYGMHLYKSDNNVLSNNTVNNTLLYTDKAIYLESADSNLIDNNTISGGHQGIYLYKSDKNTLYNNTLKSIEYCCILLVNSSNNVIDNNNISNSYYGISLYDSGNNILSNNTVKSIEYRCILLEFSSNNVIGNNAIDNNTISDGVDGIYLDNSEKNSITNNSISNTQNGIWLSSSNENRISDNFLSGTSWDLYVLDSEGNLISNNTFSTSYPTTASFRYKGNFAVRGVNNPPENPDGFDDTGSFLNISSLSDTSTWINLSICYNESNVIINEDYLLIWMHNETGWHKEGWNGTRYLDTTKNIIGVNITNPEGIFAPLQDIQPPVSTKTIGDPNCTIGGEDWITGYTPVWLDAEDNINGTGVDAIYYRVWYNESWHPADSQDSYGGNHNITMYRNIYWYVYSNNTVNFGPIYFMEEGKHYMEFFSTDRAGNEENHTNQTIYVDNTPPQVTIEMGIPSYIQDGKIFINSTTPIWINVTDMMNLYLIRWTIWNETGAVYDSGISEKNLTLYIAEEGKYTIGYWAEDGLGNRWPASGYDNDTTFYVDNTPPETDLTIGKPNHTKNNTLFVTARTPFNLSSEDGGKYPVGTEKICYRVWNIYTGWSDWRIYFANITLHEEGLHYIEYYAEDCLGNRGNVLNITCYVDDVPPVTTGRGYYPIYLMAIDPGWDGCPEVGVCCIHYRYRIGEGNWSDWFVNETNENLTLWIPNSSVSPGGEPIYLEYYSEDLLGNKENINYDVFTGEVNHPPNKPSNPSPVDGATGVDIDVTLSWQCSDPDGDNLTYDVYFGTGENQLKKVSGNQSSTTYKPSSLNYSTTYYWKIVAWDEHGESSESPVWRFTTEETPNTPPAVVITRPKNLLYFRDIEILSLPFPLIIGPVTIEVNASDSDGVVKRVDFYIDHTLKYSDTTAPFSWRWDSRAFGFKVIEVVAYDDKGAHQRSIKEVLIFNLAIL